jgi:hypothetical protein
MYCVIAADVVMWQTGAASLPLKRFICIKQLKEQRKRN